MLLLVLTMSTSINLPVIEHECNFSKMKTFYFFSLDHKCKKDSCYKENEATDGQQFSKIPCCSVETTFVNNDEPVVLNSHVSVVQAAILIEIFNFRQEPQKLIKVKEFVPIEHQKRYGYKYRIAMQSFLC